MNRLRNRIAKLEPTVQRTSIPHFVEVRADEDEATALARFVAQHRPIPRGHRIGILPASMTIAEWKDMAAQKSKVRQVRVSREP